MRTGPGRVSSGWTQTRPSGRRAMLRRHRATSRPTARNILANRGSIFYLDSIIAGLVSKMLTCKIMAIRIVQVDAFTNRPFAGNPAAVCVLRGASEHASAHHSEHPSKQPSEQWMRDVAREMNLSETAFLIPFDGGYNLRWFTPAVEVDLCGHAPVASAHVLWEDGHLPRGRQARFHTRSGLLTADRRGDWVELDFSMKIATPGPPPPPLLPSPPGAAPPAVVENGFDFLVGGAFEPGMRALAPRYPLLP